MFADIQQEPESTFTFHYQSVDLKEQQSKQFTVDVMTPWPEILKQFTDFLGSVYEYDISKDILLMNRTGRPEPLAPEEYVQ